VIARIDVTARPREVGMAGYLEGAEGGKELAPGQEACLLDGILCPFAVPQDAVRDGVAAVTVERHLVSHDP